MAILTSVFVTGLGLLSMTFGACAAERDIKDPTAVAIVDVPQSARPVDAGVAPE